MTETLNTLANGPEAALTTAEHTQRNLVHKNRYLLVEDEIFLGSAIAITLIVDVVAFSLIV